MAFCVMHDKKSLLPGLAILALIVILLIVGIVVFEGELLRLD